MGNSSFRNSPGKKTEVLRYATPPLRCNLLFLVDGAHLAILAHPLELDLAVDLREQRVVAADADVVARMDMRASLANQNVAGQHELTVGALGAQSLGFRITAVFGGAAAFMMGEELETHFQHGITPP